MKGAAACLKVQVGNEEPYIENYVDNYDDDPIELQYEQIAVYSLLRRYFMGRGAWDGYKKGYAPYGEFTVVGANIYEPAPDDNYSDLPPKMALACFNAYTLKAGLKSFGEGDNRSGGLPLNWGELVDATSIDQLQQLIEQYGGAYGSNFDNMVLTIDYKPATLTLHRCTTQEIDDLFEGNHRPHVDVFDAVKEMLVSNWSALDANGLSQAIYDQATDTIIFKSDFSINASITPA